jgi:uncharacterized lipoprotein YddW (UPF0748 family)
MPLFSKIVLIVSILSNTTLLSQSPKREFRGVWIASVANIDWPSKSNLSSDEQQKEFIEILDMHKRNGLNAVVVQIRPAADAFYPSRYEPWSKWLTGKLGQAPTPYYDPLEFMVTETHKRALEFHAWFNPYRGIINVDPANLDSASVAFQHRDWFLKYDKNLYFDPGKPEARKHVCNVIMDVVNRYDIDGVHFDDYFYPYKVANLNFPDSATFLEHGTDFASLDDWRRNNVSDLIRNISDSLKKVKPYVKFGVSPFGVWRNQDKDPKGSATKAGQTCYDDLYADVMLWMKEGWIDYVTPQVYWSIGFSVADYDIISRWWSENNFGVPVYIGQAAYRINSDNKDTHWKEADQIPRQIRLNRSLENIQGSIFFSSKSFKPNPLGICDSLKHKLYALPAIVPARKIATYHNQYDLTFTVRNGKVMLLWKETQQMQNLSSHARYVIYRFIKNEKVDLHKPEKILAIVSDTNPHAYQTQQYIDVTSRRGTQYIYVVTALNRFQNESEAQFAFPVKMSKKFWRTYPVIKL